MGILIYNYGSLNVPANYMFGIICTGNIRSISMIFLGAYVGYLSRRISVALDSKIRIFAATFIEISLYVCIIRHMHIWNEAIGKFDFLIVFAMVVAMSISLSGKSACTCILNNKVSIFWGKYSMALFLSHFYWVQNIDNIISIYKGNDTTMIALKAKLIGLILAFVTAFIVLGAGECFNLAIRTRFNKKEYVL